MDALLVDKVPSSVQGACPLLAVKTDGNPRFQPATQAVLRSKGLFASIEV